jgi:hypothetical protein
MIDEGELEITADLLQKYMDEVKLSAFLQHENIVKVTW